MRSSGRRAATDRLLRWFAPVAALLLLSTAAAEVERRAVHDGNLILEDIPEIPREIIGGLNRYQNVRSASFRAWTADSKSLYVSTGFGDVFTMNP